jgi:hypothetical protein
MIKPGLVESRDQIGFERVREINTADLRADVLG